MSGPVCHPHVLPWRDPPSRAGPIASPRQARRSRVWPGGPAGSQEVLSPPAFPLPAACSPPDFYSSGCWARRACAAVHPQAVLQISELRRESRHPIPAPGRRGQDLKWELWHSCAQQAEGRPGRNSQEPPGGAGLQWEGQGLHTSGCSAWNPCPTSHSRCGLGPAPTRCSNCNVGANEGYLTGSG